MPSQRHCHRHCLYEQRPDAVSWGVAGMDAYDRTSGQHVLWSTTMPLEAAAQVEPLALRYSRAQNRILCHESFALYLYMYGLASRLDCYRIVVAGYITTGQALRQGAGGLRVCGLYSSLAWIYPSFAGHDAWPLAVPVIFAQIPAAVAIWMKECR